MPCTPDVAQAGDVGVLGRVDVYESGSKLTALQTLRDLLAGAFQ
jgi:hypothetical protein